MPPSDNPKRNPYPQLVFDDEMEKWQFRFRQGQPVKGRCRCVWCTGVPVTYRTVCDKCRQRQWRANNPRHNAWLKVKMHAKQRRIKFTLQKEFFMDFCAKHNPGYPLNGDHLDRKDPLRGYEPDNIQFLSSTENVVKGNKERYLSRQRPDHVEADPDPF